MAQLPLSCCQRQTAAVADALFLLNDVLVLTCYTSWVQPVVPGLRVMERWIAPLAAHRRRSRRTQRTPRSREGRGSQTGRTRAWGRHRRNGGTGVFPATALAAVSSSAQSVAVRSAFVILARRNLHTRCACVCLCRRLVPCLPIAHVCLCRRLVPRLPIAHVRLCGLIPHSNPPRCCLPAISV